jgi:hypothetical protein
MSPPLHFYALVSESFPSPTSICTSVCGIHFRLEAALANLYEICEKTQGDGAIEWTNRDVDGDILKGFTIVDENSVVLQVFKVERYRLE